MTTKSKNLVEIPAWPMGPGVPTAALNKVTLEKLLRGDERESATLFASCKSSGFFLLDLRGCQDGGDLLKEAEQVFGLAEKLCDMPLDEKRKYALAPGTAFGYKAVGISKVDAKGTPDRCEFWGLSKEALFSQNSSGSTMPPLVTSNKSFLKNFSRHAHTIGLHILTHLEKHLELPSGTLTSVHRLDALSADQIRLLKMTPQPLADRGTSLLAHTDFGSVTLLWNVVGGLQILPPEAGTSDIDGTSNQWQFVQPQLGCVIVNVGNSLVSFTGGVLRSNLHRVTTPPGSQAGLERYSAVYFMRPEDDVLMRSLKDGRAERASNDNSALENRTGYHTVKEWVALKTASFQKALAPMESSGGEMKQQA